MEFYTKSTKKELSFKKIEENEKYAKIINWGRENPILFIEHFFGIKLFDYQKWILMETWTKPFALWLCSRAAGKTSLLAIYLQAKMLLVPNYKVYISTQTANQSIESFKKIEDIALQKIPSFKTCTDVFFDEVVKTPNNNTGFLHGSSGHTFSLYNDSELKSLSSNIDALRGLRGSVVYDESGWLSEEHYSVMDNYINVDSSFSLGVNEEELRIDPKNIPLQLLYCSSASDVTYPFYERYKSFSKKMFLGNPNYFVCDIDANDVMNFTTSDGIKIKSHLTQEQIDKQMEEDPERAERELFNRFRKDAGINAIVKMDTLIKNSSVRIPLLHNDDGKKKFLFTYDPARNFDNSILSIYQVIEDEEQGHKLQLENIVHMVDRDSRNKTPLPMPLQIEIIKQKLIDYNGANNLDWENIVAFYIDAGAGGGGKSAVADNLVQDWTDKTGKIRKGIIDPEHQQYETLRKTYKDAIPIVRLLEPVAYKKIMYSALERMLKFDLITFFEYDNKESIMIANKDGDYYDYKLSNEEKLILLQNNLLKNELSYMCRVETSNGNVQYDLASDKRNKMHDDRADTCAMASLWLADKIRDNIIYVPLQEINMQSILNLARKPHIDKRYSRNNRYR